jgi:hypothetical protein
MNFGRGALFPPYFLPYSIIMKVIYLMVEKVTSEGLMSRLA